jgi:hypothetical protein
MNDQKTEPGTDAPDPAVRPPLHAPPVHTMRVGHVPLTIFVALAIAWLFALAFHLGAAAPVASSALLALLLLAAIPGPRGTAAADSDAAPDTGRTAGTRFTVARIGLTCMLAGLAIVPAGDAPDPMLWSLAIAGAAAAGLEATDVWLARITNSASGYSERLGGLTASLLVLALALLVWRLGITGAWIVAAGVAAAAERGLRTRRPADPATRQQRIGTDLAVRLALAGALVPVLPGLAAAALGAAALAIALVQGALTLKHTNSAV